jgi:hypothetical protein
VSKDIYYLEPGTAAVLRCCRSLGESRPHCNKLAVSISRVFLSLELLSDTIQEQKSDRRCDILKLTMKKHISDILVEDDGLNKMTLHTKISDLVWV